MKSDLYTDVLPENQLSLLKMLAEQEFIRNFYLAGGTALALQIAHRRSLDFDFFTDADFNTNTLVLELNELGIYKRENEEKNTINGTLNGIKISFFGYKYKMIDKFRTFKNIRLAGLKDIAAMKLEAIAGRGSKKDFIDMYFLMRIFTLDQMLDFHKQKYGNGLSNRYHLMKSLAYFEDADYEAMPLMIKPIAWNRVKKEFISAIRQIDLLK